MHHLDIPSDIWGKIKQDVSIQGKFREYNNMTTLVFDDHENYDNVKKAINKHNEELDCHKIKMAYENLLISWEQE